MKTDQLDRQLAEVASSDRESALLDALAMLSDAYGFQSAALWAVAVGRVVRRGGFGDGEPQPIPREAWDKDLERAIRNAAVVQVDNAPETWAHGQRRHILVPILDERRVRGVLIATGEDVSDPERLKERCRLIVPLLAAQAETPATIADELEQDAGEVLWAALLAVQDGEDPASQRAADALRASLSALRASVATLRGALPHVSGIADACVRYGLIYGLTVEHDVRLREDALDPADRSALVAIVREALENAAVHGRARMAWVSLASTPARGLRLVIGDDGDGFNPAEGERALRRGGLGLAAIRGYAASRAGQVKVGPSDAGGVRIEVLLPEV